MPENMDKYEHPEDMDPATATPKEIASHSSLLTNKRLDYVLGSCDVMGIEARTNPCMPTIQDYFASLLGAYNIIFSLLGEDENQDLTDRMADAMELMRALTPKSSMQETLSVVLRLDAFYRTMVADMQKREYFFRIGRANIKGIANALRILNEGIL